MEARTKRQLLETMEKLNKQNGLNTQQKEEAFTFLNTAVEIGNKIFCCIPIKMLKVDHEMYQRPLQRNFKYLLDNWESDQCDPIVVNYRNDGYYYVIDGQHRVKAAQTLGITQIVCDVFVGLTLEEEAGKFVGQYNGTAKLNPIDSYRPNIIRRQIIDMLIKEICDKYGLTVARGKAPKTFRSLTVARNILRPSVTNSGGKSSNPRENLKIMEWIFNIFRQSEWESYNDTYNSDMMQSLWYVWRNNQDNLVAAERKLIEFFKTTSPKGVKSLGNIKYSECGHCNSVYRVLMDAVNEPDKDSHNARKKFKVVEESA